MKAVLMSIKPKYVELIASGKKTIEVLKNRPRIETPFKCYIYCTKAKEDRYILERHENGFATRLDGKVIGEFTCDEIEKIPNNLFNPTYLRILAESCLKDSEMISYSNGKDLYGWHISDLKIYNKPRELSEFYSRCNIPENKCKLCDNCYSREDYYGRYYAVKKLTRPPMSWQFIEV